MLLVFQPVSEYQEASVGFVGRKWPMAIPMLATAARSSKWTPRSDAVYITYEVFREGNTKLQFGGVVEDCA